jgi:hypothetical protein
MSDQPKQRPRRERPRGRFCFFSNVLKNAAHHGYIQPKVNVASFERFAKGMDMSRAFPIFVAMIALCFAGCKSESEAAVSDMSDKQKELVKILKGITDKDSAVAAKPKLQAIAKDMGELIKKMSQKKTDEAEMKKISEKYKAQMEQTQKDLMTEMMRIGQIPGAAEPVGEAMSSMGSAMGSGVGMHP